MIFFYLKIDLLIGMAYTLHGKCSIENDFGVFSQRAMILRYSYQLNAS